MLWVVVYVNQNRQKKIQGDIKLYEGHRVE